MPSNPAPLRIAVIAAVWLVLISVLHWHLNTEKSSRRVIKMGYMPVITNLAAPLLDHASKNEGDIRYQAIKYASFAEMAESLRNNNIEAAFIIAPLSIVLRQQGEAVKIVYIGNRHESTLVARKSLNVRRPEDLAGKTVAVPMRYSGHNLGLLRLLDQKHLTGQVKIVEMNPPDMASALASEALDAYSVGEPFAAQTLKSGDASLVLYVEDIWPGFICNLMIIKESLMNEDPEIVQNMVTAAARSGKWAAAHPEEAAEIASQYWNQPAELIFYALNTPEGRVRFDQFTPVEQEIREIAGLMVRYGLASSDNIDGLVEPEFARQADLEDISGFSTILRPKE